jgi:hypothetical protein
VVPLWRHPTVNDAIAPQLAIVPSALRKITDTVQDALIPRYSVLTCYYTVLYWRWRGPGPRPQAPGVWLTGRYMQRLPIMIITS